MYSRNHLKSWRWIVALFLASWGIGALAQPIAVPNQTLTANEDQYVALVVDLSTKFTDVTPGHTIVSYSLVGQTGDSLSTVTWQSSSSAKLTIVPDAYGTETYTFQATDNVGLTDTYAFTLVLNPVNDAPSFSAGADQTVVEDTGAVTVAGWAGSISTGAANETQTLTFSVTNNDNPGLFASAPAVDPTTGDLTFTPAPDANGTANITLVLSDDGGTANGGSDTSAPVSFAINVTPVNDAPGFTAGGNVSVAEDAGPQSVAWASAISAGPADEAGQTLSFTITGNSNAGLFSVLPAVDSSGQLTFTPAANANGSATVTLHLSDNGGTANGGIDTSADVSFDIVVAGVNDPPSFAGGADQTVVEDAGAVTVPAWATSISSGPADEAVQSLTFNVTANDNPALFASAPAVDPTTGDLTFTPAPDANGTANITLVLSDNGGTANGGSDTSAPVSFAINVTPVNDAPGFTAGGNVSVAEDAGPQSVAWASAISAGPADEAGQTLSFTITGNSNAGLFSVQPAVDSSGQLTFTPAANANGSATVTLHLSDNGGTASGGVDTSADVSFDIIVGNVNDPPSFAPGADQAVLEDAGPVTVPAWATSISSGPADESAQTLTFIAMANSNPALFSVQPNVDSATGDLTFTPAPDANGSADDLAGVERQRRHRQRRQRYLAGGHADDRCGGGERHAELHPRR